MHLSLLLVAVLWRLCATYEFPRPPVGECWSTVSGPSETNTVRSVFLGCEEGELHWQRPTGATLVRFRPPKRLVNAKEQYDLCWSFSESGGEQPSVAVIRNRKIQEARAVAIDESVRCEPYSLRSRISIYVVFPSNPAEPVRQMSLFYEFVRKSADSVVPSGVCRDDTFTKEFCASDFVFQGSLLRHNSRKGRMEYSVTRIMRRPAVTAGILPQLPPRSSLQTAVLHTATNAENLESMRHVESVVVATTRLGIAWMRCAMPLARFRRLSEAKNAACEVR